jgi:hypothetical protein
MRILVDRFIYQLFATSKPTAVPDRRACKPPQDQDESTAGERQAALAAVLAAAGLGLVRLGAAALVRRILDYRRLAAWDAAWQATGPSWTTQR